MTELKKLIDEFLLELYSIRQYSQNTIQAYQNDLYSFEYFMTFNEYDSVDCINEKIIRRFMVFLSLKKLSTTSISRKLSSIRSFINFLMIRDIIKTNPMFSIENPKIKRHIPDVLPIDSFQEIIKFTNKKLERDKLLKFRAIFELLYGSAIRLSELCSLDISDIDFSRNVVSVHGKGAKQRIIPIGEISRPILYEYYNWRKSLQTNKIALFLNSKGNRINSRFVQRLVSKYISMVSDIKKKSPHVLRHSAATHMLDRGADLLTVKEILGHENLSTTQIYTHVSIEHLKNSYKKAHPKS